MHTLTKPYHLVRYPSRHRDNVPNESTAKSTASRQRSLPLFFFVTPNLVTVFTLVRKRSATTARIIGVAIDGIAGIYTQAS